MGFIPRDARWYFADIVLEHRIDGDRRNVVHVNTHLIEAESPEQAYRKALTVGRQAQSRYVNTEGKQVRVRFRGLRELNVIHEDLQDGAELSYEESVSVPEKVLQRWARRKKNLGVFAPVQAKTQNPNYMPQSIMKELEEAGFSRANLEGRAERGAPLDRSHRAIRTKRAAFHRRRGT